MENQIIVWYAGRVSAEKRTCQKFGWPNPDSLGQKMYDNTHFRTEEEAWQRVLAESGAWLSHETTAVKEANRRFQETKHRLAKSAIDFKEARDNYAAYEAGKTINNDAT